MYKLIHSLFLLGICISVAYALPQLKPRNESVGVGRDTDIFEDYVIQRLEEVQADFDDRLEIYYISAHPRRMDSDIDTFSMILLDLYDPLYKRSYQTKNDFDNPRIWTVLRQVNHRPDLAETWRWEDKSSTLRQQLNSLRASDYRGQIWKVSIEKPKAVSRDQLLWYWQPPYSQRSIVQGDRDHQIYNGLDTELSSAGLANSTSNMEASSIEVFKE